ncbi:MAG TPA: DUF6602 domain-containing protein [Puia sp.]|nr:DUF6602 domain-containing protein [Puia sp.]
MGTPFFELNNILTLEAKELVDSREKAFAIHHTRDIDAAGDEVEQKVRHIIRRKLPLDYYVGHGHLVDENLNYNGQHDIVIADNSGSPILFTAENGTQYFPYESLYAIGEIKSTYYSSREYVQKYIDKITKLYTNLSRADTSPSQLSKDINFEAGGAITITSGDTRPYKNPIFKFMFFVDAGDFDILQIKDLLTSTDDKFVPNFICILNKGILVKSKIITTNGLPALGPLELFPEFIPADKKHEHKWAFVELGRGSDPLAAHLAFVFFALNQHLHNCLVLRPNLMTYFHKLFEVKGGSLIL